MKRVISLFLSLTMMVSLVNVVPVQAASYDENTYTLTGVQVNDIVGIAKTQVGYKEGNNSNQLDGTVSGNENYTKYAKELKTAGYGASNPNAWCAYFVSWCAMKAGCLNSAVSFFTGVKSCIAKSKPYKSNGLGTYHAIKNYTFTKGSVFRKDYTPSNIENYKPKKGDIMIFKTHVGLVVSDYNSSTNSFSIVEGNWGGKVNSRTVKMSNSELVGFVTPDYITTTITPSQTHSYTYSNDSTHPHSEYKYCSCGNKEYTGDKKLITSCQKCYPVGNVNLTRSFEKAKGTATFYRNNVSNTTSYILKLYHNNNLYNTYNMSSDTYTVTGLLSGNYTATLYAKNSNTNEERSSSCESFKIADTYIISYDANGGTNAPDSQTKIQDEVIWLTTDVPTREHYIFEGWARTKNAVEAEYVPGEGCGRNASFTFYAVWKPETYTVTFEANGGKGELKSEQVVYGNTIKMPNTIVKDGYYLKGWSKSKTSSTVDYKLGLDISISESMKLYAVWGSSTWSGEVSSSLNGNGTADDPYLISNAADMAYLAKMVNQQSFAPEYKYYKLTDNIKLGYTTEWVPIGVSNNGHQYFYGSFDGNGYTISDMYITQPNSGYIGLFGKVQDSDIKNITISGLIENVKSTEAKTLIGGLVGNAISTNIQNCSAKYLGLSSLSVGTNDYSCVGGIVGDITGNGSITTCSTDNCNINMKSGLYEAGIIAGHSSVDITDVSVSSTEDGLFSASSSIYAYRIGGILGRGECELTKCTVTAPYLVNEIATGIGDTYIAGLVGDFKGTASVCSVIFNNGNVKTINGNSYNSSIYANGSGKISIGGLVGYSREGAKIVDCKYDGQSVSGITSATTASVAGIIGSADAITNDVVSVDCNSTINYEDMPKREGYKATWYADPEFTTLYEFGSKLTKSITLYAKWEENKNPKPAPPEQVEITVKGLNVYVSWEAVEGADKYQVVYCNADADNREYTGIDTTLTSCSVELPEGNYIFAVQAMNRYGFSGKKEEYTVKVSKVSAIPSEIIINSRGSTVFMSWDAAYSADQYHVRYWVEGTNDYKDVLTTNTSYSVNLPDGEYLFKVQSMNRYGYSGWSEDYQVIVSQIPAFPENVILSASSSTVFMSWDAVYGADKYQVVYWDADAEDREYKSIDTTSTSCRVELPEGEYGFAVQAMNRYGFSGKKEEYYITVSKRSAIPSGLTLNVSGSNVSVKWNAVYGADQYEVLYWPIGTDDNKYIISESASCSLNLPDGEYGIKVQSMNRYGYSGWSEDCYATISTKNYNVTAISEIDTTLISRSFANVNGILYSKASNSYTGGVIGYGNGGMSSAATTDSTIFVADAISSSGTNSANLGYIIGYNKNNAYSMNKAYYNSDIEADSATDISGTAIATRLIKMESFLETQLGLSKYIDVENISNDETAVWVLRDGYLPELYYNCLNNITISDNIENGGVAIDKIQAVDGEIVTVTATPNDGYVLNKVYVDGIEQDGTTFVVDGNDEVYVTFAEEVPVFDVSIVANENTSASLVNADAPMLMSVMSRSSSGDRSITANDGEEIQVNAVAYSNYTVDSIYVNGVEVVGNSFILTKDSVVTMDVTSISTDVIATTNDAEEVGSYFAVVGGSVLGKDENAVKYIRYWSADDVETVYTTEVESGSGEYTIELMDLMAGTTYYYQMTEFGEIKSFTTLEESDYDDEHMGDEDGGYDEPIEAETQPITTTTYKTLTSTYKFSIECSQALTTEFLAIACYDDGGNLLVLEQIECDGDTSYTGSVPIDKNIDYAKIFVWTSPGKLKPLADVEWVDITN